MEAIAKERRSAQGTLRNEAVVKLCLFWCDHGSGRLVDGSVQAIMKEIGTISEATVRRIWRTYRERVSSQGVLADMISRRKGNCGRKSSLTPALRQHYKEIAQEYANLWLRLSNVAMVQELAHRGIKLSRTVQNHFMILALWC